MNISSRIFSQNSISNEKIFEFLYDKFKSENNIDEYYSNENIDYNFDS